MSLSLRISLALENLSLGWGCQWGKTLPPPRETRTQKQCGDVFIFMCSHHLCSLLSFQMGRNVHVVWTDVLYGSCRLCEAFLCRVSGTSSLLPGLLVHFILLSHNKVRDCLLFIFISLAPSMAPGTLQVACKCVREVGRWIKVCAVILLILTITFCNYHHCGKLRF